MANTQPTGTNTLKPSRQRSQFREPNSKPRSFCDIQDDKIDQKRERQAVADLIVERYFHPGDSILLDAGSSLYPIALKIAAKCKEKPDSTHFTIMTHNYRAFEILVDADKVANLNIVLAGGRYDQDLNALFGAQTASNYDDFHPRTVVIGISGLVANMGLFCHGNTEELLVEKLIFTKPCTRRIIVAHHTKLGRQDSFLFGKSTHLKAGAIEGCVLVTNKPGRSKSLLIRDKYRDEVAYLRDTHGIEVQEIDVNE